MAVRCYATLTQEGPAFGRGSHFRFRAPLQPTGSGSGKPIKNRDCKAIKQRDPAQSSPLAYPEALAELWMGDRREGLDTLRDTYLQRARQRGLLEGGKRWFTDKMPLNETHIGLIALLFPAAPLIHVIRHPLDIVLSVLSNQLTHGMFCGYALESAAQHILLTAELVEHHRAELPVRLLPVRYEALVAEPERELRRMLDFIGESFEPACLRPEENRRYARTASYAQVTQPVHDRSVGRWRHYRAHLGPAIEILRSLIERLGYEAE